MAALGPSGLARAAELSTRKAHELQARLLELPGFRAAFDGPFFKEFAVRFSGDITALNQSLYQAGFIGGLALAGIVPGLDDGWLLAVTESRTATDIDRFVSLIRQFVQEVRT